MWARRRPAGWRSSCSEGSRLCVLLRRPQAVRQSHLSPWLAAWWRSWWWWWPTGTFLGPFLRADDARTFLFCPEFYSSSCCWSFRLFGCFSVAFCRGCLACGHHCKWEGGRGWCGVAGLFLLLLLWLSKRFSVERRPRCRREWRRRGDGRKNASAASTCSPGSPEVSFFSPTDNWGILSERRVFTVNWHVEPPLRPTPARQPLTEGEVLRWPAFCSAVVLLLAFHPPFSNPAEIKRSLRTICQPPCFYVIRFPKTRLHVLPDWTRWTLTFYFTRPFLSVSNKFCSPSPSPPPKKRNLCFHLVGH